MKYFFNFLLLTIIVNHSEGRPPKDIIVIDNFTVYDTLSTTYENNFNEEEKLFVQRTKQSGHRLKYDYNKQELYAKDISPLDYLDYHLRKINQGNQIKLGWDLSQTPFIRLNFTEIAQPLRLTLFVQDKTGHPLHIDSFSNTYHLATENLNPIIDLKLLIDKRNKDQELDITSVNHIAISFHKNLPTSTDIAFRLKSVELINTADQLTSVLTPTLVAKQTMTTTPIQLSNPSHSHLNQVKNSLYNDSEEIVEENPAPEPFSILTLGTGITAFIRKRKDKKIV